MSAKAFGLTAYYDSVVSNWLNNQLKHKISRKKNYTWKINRKTAVW